MATATSNESLAVADWEHGSESKSDRYLAGRLAAAGADFKGVAVATFALATALAALIWIAVGVVAEHWLVPGGLPVAARWAWLAVGGVSLAAAVVRWIVPLVRYRVNLVYAAREIEREHPELHNDLVNAVLVKARPEGASPLVVRSLEKRAAKRLSGVPADGVFDRGLPLRLAIALAAVVAAMGVYQLVAPKSLVVSAARLVAPWWGLAAPARVSIATPRLAWRMPPDAAGGERPVQPLEAKGGVVSLVRGRQLVVETDIEGLRAGERAVLVATPLRDDGSIEPAPTWDVPLVAGGPPGRMTAAVPDPARGLEQPIEFVVQAGDARSDRVRVVVVDTPTLLVREVRYDYPAYTGRKPETVAWQGDLKAPEFTKVTITAEGNRPLETAWIDPGCTGRESDKKRMRIGQHDLARATGEFPLRMNPDRTGPEFGSYRLGFQPRTASGGREPPVLDKLEHRVEVVADVAPEVMIDAPEDAVRVPPTAPVTIRVRAVDPDYGLARVGIEARVRGGPDQPPAWLLDRPHSGPFGGAAEIVPERLGAVAGGVLEYRAVAIDTRPEKPNVAHSPWRTLQIDAGAPPPPREQQAPPRGPQDDASDPQPGDPAAGAGGEPTAGPRGQEGQRGDAGDRGPGDAADAPPRDAQMKDREQDAREPRDDAPQQSRDGGEKGETGGGAGQRGQESQGGAGDGAKGGDARAQHNNEKGESGEGRGGESKPQAAGDANGREQGGGQPRPGGREASGQQPGQSQGEGDRGRGEGKPDAGGRTGDSVASDGTNDGEAMERILDNKRRQGGEQAGRSDAGDAADKQQQQQGSKAEPPGQQPQCSGADGKPCGQEGCSSCNGGKGSGQGQSGQGQSGQGQSGQGQSGQGQSGQGQSGQGQSGQGQSGQGQSGQGQSGQGQSGQGQSGQGQSGQGQSGQGQSGQGQSGQGQSGQGQSGQGQSGQGQSGQGQSGQGQSGQGQSGQGQSGQGQSGQGQASDAGAGQQGGPSDEPGTGRAQGSKPGPGSEVGAGGQGGGDRGGVAAQDAVPPRRDAEWTEQDQAHARNAADLAIEHLRDSVNAGRTDVLDELGWTPEQARAFIERWQSLRRLAGSEDPRQRGEFDRAVRSLGLRPDGVSSSRDVPADQRGGQSQGRRGRPPAGYREQVEAYLRGTGGG